MFLDIFYPVLYLYYRKDYIVTHDGDFHPDEVFACAVIKLLAPYLRIIRSRDTKVIAKAKYAIDVSCLYNPVNGRFDHHQDDPSLVRPNGIKYAAFGLVWKHFGQYLCKSQCLDEAQEIWEIIETQLVQKIDALDNWQGDEYPNDISQAILDFMPTWDSKPSQHEINTAFHKALEFAQTILKNAIEKTRASVKAKKLIKSALKFRTLNEILVLDKPLPWRDWLPKLNEEVKLVVFPAIDGNWRVQSVPTAPDSQQIKVPLPQSWVESGDEFPQVSGVNDAYFVHKERFVACTRTQQGAIKLAKQALNI